MTKDERERLRGLVEWAATRLREDMNTAIWDTVREVPALLDALDDADLRIAALEAPPAPVPPAVEVAMAEAGRLLAVAERDATLQWAQDRQQEWMRENDVVANDRDRWHREFLTASRYVEECARLHADVRRLERERDEARAQRDGLVDGVARFRRHNANMREALGKQTVEANADALRWLAERGPNGGFLPGFGCMPCAEAERECMCFERG